MQEIFKHGNRFRFGSSALIANANLARPNALLQLKKARPGIWPRFGVLPRMPRNLHNHEKKKTRLE